MLRDSGFSLLAALAVAIVYGSTSHSPWLAMVAVLAVSSAAVMHVRLAMGRLRAVLQTVACVAALLLVGAWPRLLVGVVVTGLLGSELVARCTRRSSLVRVGMWTGIISGICIASGLMVVAPQTLPQTVREVLAAAIGGFLGAPLTLAFAPVAEWLFGHTTRWTMGEWLSYEHPLLRELASTAPGTFQHSVNVGVLADSAASAIGADAFLARVGGLYHDVGKICAPDYFTENQHWANPHDDLKPWDSARILRSHVSDGVDLVGRHRMGPRIADFVREHHGTGIMHFFRNKAAALGTTGMSQESYCYLGPRPRSRETAIVMLADQVEATARSAPPADDAVCADIVRRTLERIRGEGQLEDSSLNAREIVQLQRVLSRALQAMYHRRLGYDSATARSPQPPRTGVIARVLGPRRTGTS
ncbi:MAG: HDIG domain-containing metalloprotein [Acidobacteriota bacterium]